MQTILRNRAINSLTKVDALANIVKINKDILTQLRKICLSVSQEQLPTK